jgi:signal transduction histidine kinase
MLATISAIYASGIFAVSKVFFSSSNNEVAHTATSTALALIVAFTFQPLRRFFEKTTDRIFYRDRYDSQVVINSLSQIFVSELHIERILKKSLTALCESLHIQFGQIIVFHNDRVYRIEHYGPLPKRLMVAPELRRLNRSMLIADELDHGERKKLLDEHGIRISMLLSTREEFIGYLLLGDKLSGDIYSNQDIKVLEIAGKELAVAILNARAYAEIEAFNAHLQERVDHATKRLRVANTHLKELDRVKDEFISMASHQLRTPLTTIKGYLSMMLEGDVGPVPPQQKEFVNYAFTSSERMVNLISDLLNVSRLQAGRFIIQTKPTDMVKMIQEEVHQLDSHAKAKNLALIFDPPKQILPVIEIDENKTRQVIMNFIDNAIYYTQKGEVRVILEQTGEYVRLLVKDSGIGVPKDAQKKLFSKFFRAGNAQTVRPDGTGLGLYLAKRVVEDQGGTIIFESVEGKGSTFGFELPIKPFKPVKKEVKRGRPALRK